MLLTGKCKDALSVKHWHVTACGT